MRWLLPMASVALLSSLPAVATVFNIMDYGARGDEETDDTPAFERALQAAAGQPGSTVHAPAGRYLIAGTLTVPPHITLAGEYTGPDRQSGTILLATGGKGRADGPGCIVLQGGGCVLRNLAIVYPEQTPEAEEPIVYPYAITAGPSSHIEDIFLLNAYQGINLDGSHLHLVRNVWGEPLKVGINADHIYDISRIENVHFWPYFTLGKPLRQWVQDNGVAFQFGRSDWQSCLNTFCYGYHTGYRFYASEADEGRGWAAGVTNGSFVGIGADRAVIGIDVENAFAIGVSITNGMFAPFGSVESRAVLLRAGNQGNLTLTGCNFWAVTNILAEVQGGSLNLNACNIHEWAVLKKEEPCLLAGGGRLTVNGCTFNQGGKLAVLRGDGTRALFSGNMGADTLSILNHIGERLVLGANNPAIEVNP